MTDYISREEAEEIFACGKENWKEYEAAACIAAIPAADVRPVVLCRDCDCWNEWDSAGRESLDNYVCSCAHWTAEDGVIFYTKPTDFCSYGEKREES